MTTIETPPQPIGEIEDNSDVGKKEAQEEFVTPELSGEAQEKIFNREQALSRDDIEVTQQRLSELYREGSFEDLAKELAHLKRSKVTLAEKTKDKVFSALNGHLENVKNKGDLKGFTKYLTHLKMIGAAEVIGGTERAAVRKAMEQLHAEDNPSNQASQIFAQAKYLGVEVDKQKCADVLMRELQHLAGEGNETLRAARLARAKYLGVEDVSGIDQVKRRAKEPLSAELGGRAASGQWNRFAPLSGFYASVYGTQEFPEKTIEGMLRFADKIRKDAGEGSAVLNRYVGEVAELSRQIQRQAAGRDKANEGFIDSFRAPDVDAGAIRTLFEHAEKQSESYHVDAVGEEMAQRDIGSSKEYLEKLQEQDGGSAGAEKSTDAMTEEVHEQAREEFMTRLEPPAPDPDALEALAKHVDEQDNAGVRQAVKETQEVGGAMADTADEEIGQPQEFLSDMRRQEREGMTPHEQAKAVANIVRNEGHVSVQSEESEPAQLYKKRQADAAAKMSWWGRMRRWFQKR